MLVDEVQGRGYVLSGSPDGYDTLDGGGTSMLHPTFAVSGRRQACNVNALGLMVALGNYSELYNI